MRLFTASVGLILTLVWFAGPIASHSTTDPSSSSAYRFVVLPDTQYYSASYPEMFQAQTQWLAETYKALNVVGVIGLGDIVNSDGNEAQWKVADEAVRRIDGLLPLALASGNHDSIYSSSSLHRKYFGFERFALQPGYVGAGTHPASAGPITYATAHLMEPGWLVIAGSWIASPSDLDSKTLADLDNEDSRPMRLLRFVRDTARKYPDRRVIVAFHGFLKADGQRVAGYDWVFNNVIAPEPNIIIVLNGHELGTQAEAYRADVVNGRTVHQMLSNYQGRSNGGHGWLRILTVEPEVDTMRVQTFSPVLEQYETDANSHFEFTLPTGPIGTGDPPPSSPKAPTNLRIISGG